MQSRIWHKGALIIGVPLVLQMVLLAALAFLLQEQEQFLQLQTKSQDIETAATLIRSAEMGVCANSVLYNGTSAPQYLQRRKELEAKVDQQYAFLSAAVKNEEKKLKIVEEMKGYHAFAMKMQEPLLDPSKPDMAIKDWLGDPAYASEVNKVLVNGDKPINRLVAIERKEAASIPQRMGKLSKTVQSLLIAGLIFNLIVAVVMALMITRTISSRMAHLMINTSRLRKQEALEKPLSGSDELAELDQELFETADQVQALDQYRKQIVGVVSHELRTPLSSVRNSLELLSAGVCGTLPEKADKRIGQAHQEVDRLIRLINNLLDIEKMESGKLQLEKKSCQLSEILSSSVRAVESSAREKKVEIEFEQELDHALEVDPDRIIQVLVNLLSNAVKYSTADSKVILKSSDSAEMIAISVQDFGRGIPKEKMDKIFERYQQVEESDAQELGGLGLGLAICKSLIVLHNGKLTVKSEEGKGSTFCIHLPK